MEGGSFKVAGHLWNLLIVKVLEEGHIWDVLVKLVLIALLEVSGGFLVLLTVALAKGVLLRGRITIQPQHYANDYENQHECIKDGEYAKDHVGRCRKEQLAYLQVQDATNTRERDDESHDDASDHFGDALDCVALHGYNDCIARAALECSKRVCEPTGRVITEHVGAHDKDLEDEDTRHENLWGDCIRDATNEEDDWQTTNVCDDVLRLPS